LGSRAEQVVIHPDGDVDQAKEATADAMKGNYADDCIYILLLLTPYTAPDWSYDDWYGHLFARHAVTRCPAPCRPWLDLTMPNIVR